MASNATNTILSCNNNNNNNSANKDWPFIQGALNDSIYLNDFYHQTNSLNVNKMSTNDVNNNNSNFTSTITTTPSQPSPINDSNFAKVLILQNELLIQQAELKSNEIETMKQVKQLNLNVAKLTNKFEEFLKNMNVINNSAFILYLIIIDNNISDFVL